MDTGETLARKAEQYCADRRCELAVRALRELAAREPRNSAAAYQLGICLSGGCVQHSLTDPHRALPWFLAALSANPGSEREERAKILSALGSAWTRCTRFPRAERVPPAVRCHEEAAGIYLAARRFQDWARERYNAGVARCDLAAEQPHLWRQAIEDFRNALLIRTRARDPRQHAATLQNLGTAYRSLPRESGTGGLANALNCYRAALGVYRAEHDPAGLAAVHNNIGNVWICLSAGGGRHGERRARYALRHFDRALGLDQGPAHRRDRAAALFNRAQALACLGRSQDAARAFQAAADAFGMCGDEANASQARRMAESAARVPGSG